MRKNKNERGPLTPKKRSKTLFVVDGKTQTIPRHVADDLGMLYDHTGADERARLDRVEDDWGFYTSRFGFGLIHCKVHKDCSSVHDFMNEGLFQMRINTTAAVYVDTDGLADEAADMAAKVRAALQGRIA